MAAIEREECKAGYSAPKLTVFGGVKQLTAAGTQNQSEPTSGPGTTDPTKNRF